MSLRQQSPLVTQAVNRLLAENKLPASLTLEQCASALAMSTTSFRRKLKQEETSYKLIHSKFLNELCVLALSEKKVKIDELAIQLGYSERATFERAFRQKFGLTPSQFRDLNDIGSLSSNAIALKTIAQKIPPMADSCRELIQAKEQDHLDIQRVIDIVGKDPIFSGRLMGQASKAIYGKTPETLREAVSRNLGIHTVVNFAVVFAMQDALSEQVSQTIIEKYSQVFMLAPKLFQMIRKQLPASNKLNIPIIEQVLVFGLLGIFLLAHKENPKHQLVRHSLQGIDDIQVLNRHVNQTCGISVYLASALMLSHWHIDANVLKLLSDLNKHNKNGNKGDHQLALIQFMLGCLYSLSTEKQPVEKDINDAILEQAQYLGIENLSDILEKLRS